jgi:hypothetical protein
MIDTPVSAIVRRAVTSHNLQPIQSANYVYTSEHELLRVVPCKGPLPYDGHFKRTAQLIIVSNSLLTLPSITSSSCRVAHFGHFAQRWRVQRHARGLRHFNGDMICSDITRPLFNSAG